MRNLNIYKLPKGWRKVKLGEVAEVKTGSTDVKDAVEHGRYPLFDRSTEIKRSDKYLFNDTAIILPGEGREFIPRFYTGKFDLHQRAYAIFPYKEEIDPRYLYYAVLKERNVFSQWAVGSTVKSLRMPIIKSVELMMPKLQTQKRIADILSAFDDKIELNNKISAALEQMAQTIFKEWFVDFRFPGHEKVKMVDSELGKIPEGWEVKKIKDVAKIQKGISYSSADIIDKPAGVPMLNLANFLRGGGFNPLGIKHYTGKYKETDLMRGGDIIIAMTDLTSNREVIGHPARVPTYAHWERILISLDVCAIKTDEFLRDFLYYLMLRKDFAFRMASSAGGTNVAHLNKSSIEDYTFALPSGDLLKKFYAFVNPVVISKNNTEVENQKLAALRDLLLPKLMSGEIRV